MTIDAIREATHAQPFQPFKLRWAGGPVMKVAHPDFIAFGPKGRTVVVYQPDDSFKVIDTVLISAIEFSRGNGKRGTALREGKPPQGSNS